MDMLGEIRAVLERDPAARNGLEVFLTSPGVHAIFWYRVAHRLHTWHCKLLARMISQWTRLLTGIEIHPGAEIGKGFFIDHGMGVVIGETCQIGDDCSIFQGVTLGGTGKDHGKRHPTLGNGVMVGAGSMVLGPITLGDHVKVGAASVVLKDVPPGCTVVGNPGRVVRCYGRAPQEAVDLEHGQLPDPMMAEEKAFRAAMADLEQRLHRLETGQAASAKDA